MLDHLRVLLIEDETLAANRLGKLLQAQIPQVEILGVMDSVEDSVEWLRTHPSPDLLFCDIQLADGLSFEIFELHKVEAPVVFTTAYDAYALQAFEVYSLDYLLKPIEAAHLTRALEKYQRLQSTVPPVDWQGVLQAVQAPQQVSYQQRFLIKLGEQYRHVPIHEVAYFMAAEGVVLLVNQAGRQYPVEFRMEDLSKRLNPARFFRINRKFLVSVESIHRIHSYFNSRLKLELHPASEVDVIVSRERVNQFKAWLNQ